MTNKAKRWGAVLLAVGLAGGLGACGDDDDDDTAAEDTSAESEGEDDDAALVAACEAYVALPEQIPDDGPPEDPEAAEALLADLEAGAPESVSGDVDTLVTALRDALGGNPEALTDEVFATYSSIGAGLVEECPADEIIEVDAVDYAFVGISETMPAGRVNVRFTNTSDAEEHELVVVRRNEGTTESLEELMELPEEEVEAKITDIGFTFAPPGGEGAAFLELEPGEYIAACFIPVGGAEDGPPHASQGMVTEFTVE
jgi:hypothetical protein